MDRRFALKEHLDIRHALLALTVSLSKVAFQLEHVRWLKNLLRAAFQLAVGWGEASGTLMSPQIWAGWKQMNATNGPQAGTVSAEKWIEEHRFLKLFQGASNVSDHDPRDVESEFWGRHLYL